MEDRVVFHTPGKFDTDFLKLFGVSAKETANPIGRFGTGLKYAIAILLREKQEVRLFIEDTVYHFYVQSDTKRGKEFEFVWMKSFKDGDVIGNERLPFTTDYGKDWKLWMAFRELYSNTMDENGTVELAESYPETAFEETAFVVTGQEFLQVVKEKEDVFLPSKPINKTAYVDIHEGQTKAVFNRGIKVGEFEKPMMHRYDITGYAFLSEDRQLQSEGWFNGEFADSITRSNDNKLIEQIVTAPKNFHESTINFDRNVEPSEAFLKTVKKLIRKGKDKVNPTVIRLYETFVKKVRAIRNDPTEHYVISLIRPEGVSITEMTDYIKEAVCGWNGSYIPEENNLTDLDDDTVKVRSLAKAKQELELEIPF